MNYFAIKYLHVTCAVLSGSFFMLRGIWMLRNSAMLQQRRVRIAPHIVDTLLLVSALTLAGLSGQYPFVQNWLTAKVIALVAYIFLGAVALKRGKTKQVRTGAFIGALLIFAYIVCVAISKRATIF
jgi:uncharacterized membrane protein SirB2